jgi:hypothetical protein
MSWKHWFTKHNAGGQSGNSELPPVRWLGPADNPWGVRLLDIQRVTLGMTSTSQDPKAAINAMSFAGDDGLGFIGETPQLLTVAKTQLHYRVDRMLADGVLFIPRKMEHKWAIYFHRKRIIFVRSWLRQVFVVADIESDADEIIITSLHGTFTAKDDPPAFTARIADYLLRSHALDLVYPAPLLGGIETDPQKAALWCFSVFGNKALYATPHELTIAVPDKPLRTHSLLHIAVACGDARAAQVQLDAGVPVDLLAGDGLAPLHWSIDQEDTTMSLFLIEHGSPVDIRSGEGATPLMNAVQRRSLAKASWFLEHGADPNAKDTRGFTALHRAAEMGELPIAQKLLSAGASPVAEAQGFTPKDLAEKGGHEAVAKLLGRA